MSAQIVIRSSERKAYFGPGGQWAQRLTQAVTFKSAAEAEAVCREQKLRDVEILVLRGDRPPMRIPLPTSTRRKQSAET